MVHHSHRQSTRIKQITSHLYQPPRNGSAERLLQTFKQILKSANPGLTGPQRLSKILLQFRTKPHALTGKSPAELKTRLDLIKPRFTEEMRSKQENQIQKENKLCSFQPSDKVSVRNHRPDLPKWSAGTLLLRW